MSKKDPKRWRCKAHGRPPLPTGEKSSLGLDRYYCGNGCRCGSGELGEYACHFEPIPEEDFVDPGVPAYEDLPPEAHLPMEDLEAMEALMRWVKNFTRNQAELATKFGDHSEAKAWGEVQHRALDGLEILSRLKGGRDE